VSAAQVELEKVALLSLLDEINRSFEEQGMLSMHCDIPTSNFDAGIVEMDHASARVHHSLSSVSENSDMAAQQIQSFLDAENSKYQSKKPEPAVIVSPTPRSQAFAVPMGRPSLAPSRPGSTAPTISPRRPGSVLDQRRSPSPYIAQSLSMNTPSYRPASTPGFVAASPSANWVPQSPMVASWLQGLKPAQLNSPAAAPYKK
jgi:hypothetical protein